MSPDPVPESAPPKSGSRTVTLTACTLLILAAAGGTWLIYSTQPKAKRTVETRKSAMLVETIPVEHGNFRPTITTVGTVQPSREIVLSPRVSGEIVERSPDFSPGGFIDEGGLLLRVDPSDFQNTLAQKESELEQAGTDLRIEMGRQKVAQLDFELLDESIAEANRELVLRQPQLSAARAMLASAEAAVEQARLDLERCTITAPFDAHVLERNVDVGSQVAPGNDLGRLVGLETYWVVASVPVSALPWIDIPSDGNTPGSKVFLRNRSAWPEGVRRIGTVERLIGSLDRETRLARLVVAVEDPLARKPDAGGSPALIIGSILEATIEGREITDAVRLPRAYLRQGDTVWTDRGSKLHIVNVDVVFRDADFVYIREGLEPDAMVVTTGIRSITEGAPLRIKSNAP